MAESDVEVRLTKIEKVLWIGNGTPSLTLQVNEIATMLRERDRMDRRHDAKLNFIIAIGTLFVLAISSLAAVLALNHPNRTQSILQNLSTSQYQYTLAERTTK
jgi:hypothetical protein